MIKGLFNCTTNNGGGGIQNAVNFILSSSDDKDISWVYVVSPQVDKILRDFSFLGERILVTPSPSRSKVTRKKLSGIAESLSPDFVYTMAGPAFVKFNVKHFLGCSNPYVTNLDWLALRCERSWLDSLITWVRAQYQTVQFLYADHWLFQTEASRNGFTKKLRIDRNKTSIVPNCLGASFSKFCQQEKHTSSNSNATIKILCPCLGYPHKSLMLIPKIIELLKKRDPYMRFTFTVTIDPKSKTAYRLNKTIAENRFEEHFNNIGPFSYFSARQIYSDHDVVFLPSVLEVFSTSYLEAIAMRKILIVADRSFAREICGEAAAYFTPMCAISAANLIYNLGYCHTVRDDYFAHYPNILSRYGNYEARYQSIKEIICKNL